MVENLAYLLPVLGCAAMMGVMMWMMRGSRTPTPPDGTQADASTREEIAGLRAELAALREQQTNTTRGQPSR